MYNFVKGTCETMCPPNEIKMRTREKLLHFYERNHNSNVYEADNERVVKEFARSAAGVKAPKHIELRTPAALQRTVEYLLTDILSDTRKPFNVAYDFIFDRMRAIRQEIVMQNFDVKTIVDLIEPIAMFLAYSAYRLVEETIDKFDPKICHQHLQECLKKLLSCYDELDSAMDYRAIPSATARRETIESIYLLFNLGNFEALTRGLSVSNRFRQSLYAKSLQISLDYWNGRLHRCLISIPKLPHLLCAVASLNIQKIRRQLLLCFSLAYQSKVLSVPFEWIQKLFLYGSEHDLVRACKYYQINVDQNAKVVKFNRADFDDDKLVINSQHERFVEDILKNILVADILLFNNIRSE